MGVNFEGKVQITRDTMVSACYLGTAEHLIAILSTPGMHANKRYADTTPLVAAVRSHSVEIVRVVLDAGADVDLKVGRGRKEMSPMDTVLKGVMPATNRIAIARLLLDRGATLPEPSTWSASHGYRALKGMFEDEEAKR